MTKSISDNRARQGSLGRPVLGVLLAALVLAGVAWGIAEIYGEQIKTPATQQGKPAKAISGTDGSQPPQANSNSEPVDQNPQVDKNPTPQSSTGGDQQGTQPTQPAAPIP